MRRSAKICCLAALTQLLTLCSNAAADQNCLKFIAPDLLFYENFIPSIQKSFEASGICFMATYVEPVRATLILQKGHVDGELARVPDYQSLAGEDIVMVSEPILDGYGMLVAKSVEHLSLASEAPGEIAAGVGTAWHDRLELPKNRLIYLDNYESALQMLEKGRVSAVLIDSLSLMTLRKPDEKLVSKRLTPKTTGHLFVHKRLEDRLHEFNAAIRKWKSEQKIDEDAS